MPGSSDYIFCGDVLSMPGSSEQLHVAGSEFECSGSGRDNLSYPDLGVYSFCKQCNMGNPVIELLYPGWQDPGIWGLAVWLAGLPVMPASEPPRASAVPALRFPLAW